MRTYWSARWFRMIAAAVAVVGALAACSGDPVPPPVDSSPGAHGGAEPRAKLQDPPQAFAPDHASVLQGNWFSSVRNQDIDEVMTVGDGRAYAYDTKLVGVTGLRLADGGTAWSTRVPDADKLVSAPRFGGGIVAGAFRTDIAGTGTAEDRAANVVVGFDAASGRTLWSQDVGGAENDDSDVLLAQDDPVPEVIDMDAEHVLVTVASQGYSETPARSVLLDARTGKVLWTDDDLTAVDLDGSAIDGLRRDGDYAGVSVADGHRLWERSLGVGEAQTSDAGPGLTLAVAIEFDLLIDPATGKVVIDFGDTLMTRCDYDGRDTTVCSGRGADQGAAVWAVDVHTHQVLWRLPDAAAHREAPGVTAAWHGVVYGVGHDPMTLDARTGKDLRATTGLDDSPFLVTAGYGLVYDDLSHSVTVYQAAGG
ncbi:PQQ-binding-like beta-propeller repeat protein [Streptomyces sp. NBC_01477]|uniref:PQQ-binding-like beta-propeller repeat protein n=1 Tax=Streptomyces sp. NBC_01477 TaxID=2976015 RepID=UPI002E306736|nr:PQQ-binding-like beta-propeller repeat protein [Streptomyces sp. NBC_01477]